MSRGNSRDELRCPFTLELVCLYGYSSMKHLRLVADVGHELEWHHTLKQTIKCTLEKSKSMKRMQGRTFFFLDFNHICIFKLEEFSMPLLFQHCHYLGSFPVSCSPRTIKRLTFF